VTHSVIPAEAGIQGCCNLNYTQVSQRRLDSRLRGSDGSSPNLLLGHQLELFSHEVRLYW
jgi:hypothetical protein